MSRRHLMKVGDTLSVVISDLGHSGEGVAKLDDLPIFVPGALVGESVTVTIDTARPTYCKASVQSVDAPSPHRTVPPCPIFGECGGCQLQHLDYRAQLDWKWHRVNRALQSIGKVSDPAPKSVIGMDIPFHYRNKVLIPLSTTIQGLPCAGFYKPGSHHVVPMTTCHIQDSRFTQLISETLTYLHDTRISIYDERTHFGVARAILARASETQLVVCLVINGASLPHQDQFVKAISSIPGVTGIGIIINQDHTNVPITDEARCLYGSLDVTTQFDALNLTAPAHNFFQVNPEQSQIMIKTVQSAIANPVTTIFDLYCGVGPLGLAVASRCDRLFGNEISPIAIQYAHRNAAQNGILNARFDAGDAPKITRQWAAGGASPDVVIVDPPRKGCSEEMIRLLLEMSAPQVVYVSCDPATLARDIGVLKSRYTVDWIQPIDMFPQTSHIECVASLNLGA